MMLKRSLLLFPALVVFAACTKPPMLSTAKNAAEAYDECHHFTEDKNYEKVNQCFELLRGRYNGSVEAIEADIEVADNYFRQKDYLVAAEAYKAFARLHPAYEKIHYVYYRTGLSYLRESPKAIDRDQQYLDDAIHYFTLTTEIANNNPYQEIARQKWIEARTRLAGRSFYIGRFYYRQGQYLAAIPRFEEIVTKHTHLGYDEKALYYLGRSWLGLGKKDKCLEIVSVFDQHFPSSPYRKKLAHKLGMS